MRFSYYIIAFLLCFSIIAQDNSGAGERPTRVARERLYDVVHYRLHIEIDEHQQTCEGDVTMTLHPMRLHLDSLIVDASEMAIQSVNISGKRLEYRQDSSSLHIALDKEYVLDDTLPLQISYKVTSPTKGLYFITPDSGYPNKQYQVWSQGQAEDNHYWFPCYEYPNDKATSEMIVTVNDTYTTISNGTLLNVKKDTKAHTATYHWLQKKPVSSYLISLIVGDYKEIKESWRGIPVNYYVYPQQKKLAKLSFGKTCDALEFFSNTIGYQYPWEKYSQTVVQDFIYSGMENVSATTLTDGTIHDERAHLDVNSDGLMAHELAHQWFGDLVTPRDWSHAWLSEGFASYFDMLYQEHDKGRDIMDKSILDTHRSLLASDVLDNRRPTVWNHYQNPSDIYDNRIYGKGAAILHMLRFTLGDDLFWKCIHEFVVIYQYGLVETNDFKLAIEDVSGYNLQKFFDQWVYHAGFPDFLVEKKFDSTTNILRLNVKQIQSVDSLTEVFETPVDIQVWVRNSPKTYRVMISKIEQDFQIQTDGEPQLVIFDKGNQILKQVEFDKSTEEWLFQLQHAQDGIDRLLASDALRWFIDSDTVLNTFSQVAMDDPTWYVRQAAVFALGRSKKNEVQNILIKIYGDRDARVRSSAVSALGNFETEESKKMLIYAFEKDLSYYVASSALRSLQNVDPEHGKEYCEIALYRESYRNILRTTALNVMVDADSSTLEIIKSYTRYGNVRDLRVDALNLLCRKWGEKDEIIDYIISLLNDPSFHIRRTAITLLGSIGRYRIKDALQHHLEVETDSRLIKLSKESIKTIEDKATKDKK